MEHLTEIFGQQFKLNTEIEEIDLNLLAPDTTCYFYSPCKKLKKSRSRKIKIDKSEIRRGWNLSQSKI